MGLLHQDYNKRFIETIQNSGQPIIDTQNYGVELVPASNVAEGEMYWQVIGIHHLTPEENMSNHHVYLDALDENGNRVSPPAWVGWTWEGRQPDERADPVCVDKPANEIGTNLAMFKGQRVSVWVQGKYREATDKSDLVRKLHIEHPDEPLPDGRLLTTYGHHSFYVVFQWRRKTGGSAGMTHISTPPTDIKPIEINTPASNKPIAHYVLIAPDNKQTNLTLATNYALTFGVTLGFSVTEAQQAQKVTILGTGLSAADIQAIQASGSQVETLTDDIGGKLASRIQSGAAFVA